MSRLQIRPTGNERRFPDEEIIVSKTDPRGKITYVNDVFVKVSGYDRRELVGSPHSLIRHPEMPRCVFQLMWETIAAGSEVFAYVVNLCKNGDHYWVYAHVTPTLDAAGRIVGYHSSRRTADRRALAPVQGLYAELRRIEAGHSSKTAASAAGLSHIHSLLRERGLTYDEYVWSL
jgi:PAS domain S-box-containing protein